jgi:MoaA/NifB/PqqE/SkfB family radical SAM enzyme
MIVVWRVVESCNLSCPFCAYDKRLGTVRAAARPQQIERFVDLLGDWQATSGRRVLVSWLGGEPLLWKPLEALTRRARARNLEISVTTNGTTLGSRRMRAHLLENYREITISVDGFPDFHDRMRGWPDGFAKLARGAAHLMAERARSGSPLRLRANVVLMRENVGQFADLCRELSGWGVCEISFNQLGGRDRPEFFPANRLTLDDIAALRRMLPSLRREIEPATHILGGAGYLDRIEEAARDLPAPVADCRVADDFLFIDEQGRIAPCSFTSDHFGVTVDDIADTEALAGLAERLNGYQRRHPSGECANCRSTQQFAKFDAL